jgi:hypothetical protein
MPLYFAYGSNLDVAQMEQRCHSPALMRIAYLPHHRFVFAGTSPNRENMGVGSLRAAANQQLAGVIWSITDADLKELDAREGFPSRYQREHLTVVDLQGLRHQAFVYFKSKDVPLNPPCQAYLLQVLQAYEYHGFDSEIIHQANEEAKATLLI